ncbi:hypothetical protein Lupro_00400 [Lutibacter profundi]|uniref:STAS/SEC14 domain-containing protein n=1 Tax=Lutibacter profundi TaxID=1622118 RepID=A0A0X8G498_9FLAO|nr:hypothetical protein [Lutibacter profundi]AMC09814.1 hypothetical protein Lupro_00400 [Lutibacter profundi]
MSGLISRYKILKEHNLVIEYHSGILEFESFIKFVKKKISDPKFYLGLNHLIDFKDVTFNTTKNDITKSVGFFAKELLTKGERRNIAVLTSTPKQVVSATLYKIKQQESNSLVTIEIFSTSKRALEWLNIKSISIDNIIEIKESLKN